MSSEAALTSSTERRYSRLELALASGYLLLALVLFGAGLYSATTNPADSGLGMLGFYLLLWPWNSVFARLPDSVVYAGYWSVLGPGIALIMMALNCVILYLAGRWLGGIVNRRSS